MEERIADYYVFPSVVKSGENTEILINPRGEHARFNDNNTYLIKFVPMECCNVKHELSTYTVDFDSVTVKPQNGSITFTYCFEEEQEWRVVIQENDNPQNIKLFHIYSVFSDLHGKKAYKGDLHIHSNRSDGKEEPAIVAANYRKAGFDFMALTDHHNWYASKEAIDKYKNVDIDLKLFLGEEVHVPEDYVHVVNFGGMFSVNELYHNNKEKIDAEIRENARNISVPEGINALEYSYRKWILENIRKASGLSILVHPFWIWRNQYHMQTKMTEYLFQTNCFDAFELLGGLEAKENNLQTALYTELCAKGRKIPIVGSSDSHGTEPPVYFNMTKTILFSENLEFENICKNIKDFYSVAVDTAQGENYQVYGAFRMVKYAIFLMDYYFPCHDELCIEEGILMKNYICGDEEAKNQLSKYSGRTTRYIDKFFGCCLASI